MGNKIKVRERIIDVARKVFAKYGYKKTTMDDIAIGAQKGKSSIYYYFKSKEEIFEAVVETESKLLFDDILRKINHPIPAKEKFRVYVFTRLNKIRELSNFYDVLENNFISPLEFIEELQAKYYQREIGILQDILNEGVNNCELNIQDPEIAAIALVTAIKGLEAPLIIRGAKRNLERQIDYVLKILFYGIMRRN
jgi:AcrR family transcriptional regulator